MCDAVLILTSITVCTHARTHSTNLEIEVASLLRCVLRPHGDEVGVRWMQRGGPARWCQNFQQVVSVGPRRLH